jgi:hypothetical protein
MEKQDFQRIDSLLDDIAEDAGNVIEGEVLAAVKAKLGEISAILGEPYSVTLDVNVNIFDPDRMKTLPLLQTGLSSTAGSAPHRCWGDSSPQRYVADGELCIVPHDHCPVCWGRWDAKEQHTDCPECGASMGKQVMLLLDNDACPHCEGGSVTASDPTCTKCSYTVNPNHVVWG